MKTALQFKEVDKLFGFLIDAIGESGSVSVIVDYDTAKELLFYALDENFKLGIIDIDTYEYDNAYIATFTDDDDNNVKVCVEKAMNNRGFYVGGADDMYIDYNLPCRKEYVATIASNPFYDTEVKYFILGENMKVGNEKYDYHNKFENGNRFADITISSNIKDFVDILRDFVENYF